MKLLAIGAAVLALGGGGYVVATQTGDSDPSTATATFTNTVTYDKETETVTKTETVTQTQTVTAPTTPPTTTTTPPAGTIRFNGGFDAAEPIQGQWNGAQCENGATPDTTSTNRGKVFVVTDIVTKPTKAARFDLEAGRLSACEVLHNRTLGTGQGFPPLDEWYAMSVRFPANLKADSWGLEVAQLNFQNIWGAPLALVAYGPGSSVDAPLQLRLVGQAGECVPVGQPNPHCAWSSGPGGSVPPATIIPNADFTLDVWHDLLVHVVWSTSASEGRYEGFHRQRGGEWSQTAAFSGKPTVQWKTGGFAHPAQGTNDKIGAYRPASTLPVSMWHDNFCSGTTRAIVETCLQ